MISPKSIEEVMTTVKIEEVIEDFVNLKRKGTNYTGLCPFHDEKTPSFAVSPSKGIFKCFGCGKGGSALNFIMEHESLSYTEAIRYLANKYRIELVESQQTQEDKDARELSDSLYILNDFARQYYQDQLFNTDEGKSIGLSYFKERGYLETTIREFGLGYAPNTKDGLTKAALKKQFKEEHLKLLGLTTRNDYDFFRTRVMFSVHNLSGKVVALAGRIMTSDKTQPKYINSPESEIYVKHKILYGIYQAKTAIRKEDECILVEGYTDVITLHQGGIRNVVASSGTALNKEQVRLIKRFTQNIKLIYDGDPAGINAALRGLDIILEEDMNIRLVLLPDKEDPDSFFKKNGTEKFAAYLKENEKDFILFKADHLLQFAGNDPIKRVEVFKEIIQSIAKVADHMKRFTYVNLCSTLMKMDEQILIAEVAKVIDQNLKARRIQENRDRLRANREVASQVDFSTDERNEFNLPVIPVSPRMAGDEYQERDLARIMICGCDKKYSDSNETTIAEYLIDNIEDLINSFDNSTYKSVFTFALNKIKKNEKLSPHDFVNNSNSDLAILAVDFLYTPYTFANWARKNIFLETQKMPDENFPKDALNAVLRFKFNKYPRLINEMQKKLTESIDLSEEDKKIELLVTRKMQEERSQIAKLLNNVVYPKQ
ncbi:MAG: DNA primase [Saprospiraceae bacterium]|nr:DNA primase [Saprospiraceae bacterium]